MLRNNISNPKRTDSALAMDFFYNEVQNENKFIDILCLGKNGKILYQNTICENTLKKISDSVLESHMVIIRFSEKKIQDIVEQLGKVCREYNNYAPIVCFGDEYILFFPKLRYQDNYLIKSIIEKKYSENEKIYITYGGRDLAMV